MDTESIKKNRKYSFNISNLGQELGVSRISLYKYFDLFELLQKELNLPKEKPFGFEEVYKVSPKSATHYKQDRIEFLNKLRNFYWDILSNNKGNYSQNEIILKYFPRDFIENNYKKSLKGNNYFDNISGKFKSLFDVSEVNIDYKTSSLVKEFFSFVKEYQLNMKRDVIYQKLIEYIELLHSKYKNGK